MHPCSAFGLLSLLLLAHPSAPSPSFPPRHAVPAAGHSTAPRPQHAPFVPPAPGGNARWFVSPSGSDANSGSAATQAWRTLQKAADNVQPGDIVEVADGSYARFTLSGKQGTAAAPIVFRATGRKAIVDSGTSSQQSPDARDAIKLVGCRHVLLHGLGADLAWRAGCRISDSLHVTVQGGTFLRGGTWGIFTDYSDDVSLLGNECAFSGREHGIYHSNSGDRARIAGNSCHDNRACGIQINADPQQQNPGLGKRGDGISEGCVVERNLCYGNGAGGGAALNFASLRDSDVRHNVLVDNLSQSGIVLWDDGNQSGGAGPGYGSIGNRVWHNTVVFQAGQGRYCVSLTNGSTGNDVRNNVLRGGARGAIAFTHDSLPGLVEDGNVVGSASGWALFVEDTQTQRYTLAQWQALTGGGSNDVTAAPVFTRPHLREMALMAGSPGHDAALALPRAVADSYEGTARPAGARSDRGAYER